MNFQQLKEFLVSDFGVKNTQVTLSFGSTRALKEVDMASSRFSVSPENPEDYIDLCGGRIPLKVSTISIEVEGQKKPVEVTVYTTSYLDSGVEKITFTTSPKKKVDPHRRLVWE